MLTTLHHITRTLLPPFVCCLLETWSDLGGIETDLTSSTPIRVCPAGLGAQLSAAKLTSKSAN